jgi:peptidoglycan/LPS O-acetylase OafA/YrhL
MRYRREIDGLRAVAVVPVILFHAGVSAFSGGFVGVDVFFVISGYLITSLIVDERRSGTFTFSGFYERRARRILPALIVVTIACLPFAWLWLLPTDLRSFSASVVAVCTMTSNFLFWRESGYFGPVTDLKPLVHTWSLAVEEQYYVLYPVFLGLIWRWSARWRTALLVAMSLASLALAQWGALYHPQAAFYLLPTRGWELLLGALAALYMARGEPAWIRGTHPRLLPEVASLCGLALIAYAVVAYDPDVPYPSAYTLVPTAGAILVILFASPATTSGRLLGSRAFVGLGLISYSAYLWHQPLFAFARHRGSGEPAVATLLALSLAAVALAGLSWKFIERPFRDRQRISRTRLLQCVGVSTAVLIALGTLGYATKGFSHRYTGPDRELVELDPYEARTYVTARFTDLTLKPFDASARKKVVVIGDSYAQDLINAIYESGLDERIQSSTYLLPAACGNLWVQEDLTANIRRAERALCAQIGWYDNSRLRELMGEADAVWIASSWARWQVDLLPESLQRIREHFGPKAWVFGNKDFGAVSVKDLLRYPASERIRLENPMGDEHLKVNELLKSRLTDDVFVNVSGLLCGDGRACPLFTDTGQLLSYDGGHLTRAGARYYGERLTQTPIVRRFLETR